MASSNSDRKESGKDNRGVGSDIEQSVDKEMGVIAQSPAGAESYLSERCKIKLSLAAELVSKASYRYDPVDRADWLIRKAKNQERQRIYLYQFFSADEVMKLSGTESIEDRFKEIGIGGFTRNSLNTRIEDVWKTLESLDTKPTQEEITEEKAADIIKYRVGQIAKGIQYHGGAGPNEDVQGRMVGALQEHLVEKTQELLVEYTQKKFIPKTWILSRNKVECFKDYSTLSRPEDWLRSLTRLLLKTRSFFDHALFSCVCVYWRIKALLDHNRTRRSFHGVKTLIVIYGARDVILE